MLVEMPFYTKSLQYCRALKESLLPVREKNGGKRELIQIENVLIQLAFSARHMKNTERQTTNQMKAL